MGRAGEEEAARKRPLPAGFARKKDRILRDLAAPEAEYADASPKGSVDVGVRDLIADLNAVPGLVTTSSCAGRVCVFVEGCRKGRGEGEVGGGDGGGENLGYDELGDEDAEVNADLREEGEDREEVRGAAKVQFEGKQQQQQQQKKKKKTLAGVGGKGGGGSWLFVSHDPVPLDGKSDTDLDVLLGLGAQGSTPVSDDDAAGSSRLVHFKFEPMVSSFIPRVFRSYLSMCNRRGQRLPPQKLITYAHRTYPQQILHVLAASLEHAQLLLRCGLQAGFRESGAINVASADGAVGEPATPMVAIRTAGLALESLIGFGSSTHNDDDDDDEGGVVVVYRTVPAAHLRTLLRVANERFVANAERIARFRALLLSSSEEGVKKQRGPKWEDAVARRERLRAEGLRRREEIRRQRGDEEARAVEEDDNDGAGAGLFVDALTLDADET